MQPYAEVRHLSADASREEWEAICRSNYEQATYVVFDRHYTAPDSIRSEEVIHFFDDTELLEPKSNPLYVLKDVKKSTFSNSMRETDT